LQPRTRLKKFGFDVVQGCCRMRRFIQVASVLPLLKAKVKNHCIFLWLKAITKLLLCVTVPWPVLRAAQLFQPPTAAAAAIAMGSCSAALYKMVLNYIQKHM
jgi:hypothetical protein